MQGEKLLSQFVELPPLVIHRTIFFNYYCFCLILSLRWRQGKVLLKIIHYRFSRFLGIWQHSFEQQYLPFSLVKMILLSKLSNDILTIDTESFFMKFSNDI